MGLQDSRIDWTKPWKNDDGLVGATQTNGFPSADIFDASEWPDNSEDAQKIAALIAAAPDLLAALKLLHDDTAEYQRINKLGGYENHAMQMARAAIAKVEGR